MKPHASQKVAPEFILSFLLTTKAASRKPAIPIITDDEDEDSQLASRSKTVGCSHRKHGEETDNQSVTTKSSEGSQSDEEAFDDGAGDLQGLGNDILISTLHSEVVSSVL